MDRGTPLVLGLAMSRPVQEEGLQRLREAAGAGGRALEARACRDPAEMERHLPELEVLLGRPAGPHLARASRLRWVQAESAGVDGFPLTELARAGVVLTNARGLYAEAMAEHCLALLLALVRRIPEAVREQDAHRWRVHDPGVLQGHRLGILGYGTTGRALAERACPFGLEIWASRFHPRPDPLVRRMFGPSRAELLQLLGGCDLVAAMRPSTPATAGLLDSQALAAMRPGAYLVNVGREDLIVAGALAEALDSGRLGGVGLDTPPAEATPGSRLWTTPGVLITPHVAGARPDAQGRVLELFADNLGRYCRGEPLRNRIDLEAGY